MVETMSLHQKKVLLNFMETEAWNWELICKQSPPPWMNSSPGEITSFKKPTWLLLLKIPADNWSNFPLDTRHADPWHVQRAPRISKHKVTQQVEKINNFKWSWERSSQNLCCSEDPEGWAFMYRSPSFPCSTLFCKRRHLHTASQVFFFGKKWNLSGWHPFRCIVYSQNLFGCFLMSQKPCIIFMSQKEVTVKGLDNVFVVFLWHRYSANRSVETHMSGASKNLASQTQVSFTHPCLQSLFLDTKIWMRRRVGTLDLKASQHFPCCLQSSLSLTSTQVFNCSFS